MKLLLVFGIVCILINAYSQNVPVQKTGTMKVQKSEVNTKAELDRADVDAEAKAKAQADKAKKEAEAKAKAEADRAKQKALDDLKKNGLPKF